MLTINRMPVLSHGRHIGWVVTLRDRTEMLELQRELDLTRDTTDALRAQAHEFSNRMHVVSGLIELGEYDEARGYVRHIADTQTRLTRSITSHVADPAVAALLIAKSSQADERHVELVLAETTDLDRLDEQMATDVNTVLGNLIDNALDAVRRRPRPRSSPSRSCRTPTRCGSPCATPGPASTAPSGSGSSARGSARRRPLPVTVAASDWPSSG